MTPESATRQVGLEAIQAMFARAAQQNRPAFMPYYPIGYPTYGASLEAIQVMAEAGVDGFELGVPFSDPLADGPTIQAATQVALENGTTVRTCLQALGELRERGVEQPALVMSYLNPLLAYGLDDFVRDAKANGADGLLIPDLPPEELPSLGDACRREELALPFFLAPISSASRIALVGDAASGFIYVVSLTGVTGARSALPGDLAEFIQRVRDSTGKPLVLGFGISTPEHVRAIHDVVDGFIVGSALVKAGGKSVEAVRKLAASLQDALGA